MKLDRLNEYVLVTTVMVVGTVLAVVCGRLAGSGDNFWLVALAAFVISAIICMTMRTKIWLLLPIFWVMSGQMNSMPYHMPFRDLVVILVVAYFLTLRAFKVIHFKPVYPWLDFLLALNVLYLLSAYIRNPVGANVFGTELVGGRPYLEVVFAVGAYWVLNQILITPDQAKRLPIWFSIVAGVLAIVSAITYLFPATVPVLGKLYGGIDAESYTRAQSGESDDIDDSRASFLAGVTTSIYNLMCSYFSPLTLVNPLYIWRFLATCLAAYFCLKSGHRLTIFSTAGLIFLATYFRNGARGILIMSLVIVPPVALLISMQGNLYELPEPVQRTLSIFPGKWDPQVVSEAQGSTDWRVEMWRIMMSENKYIHNKTFGDGFGFNREELASMNANGDQEDFMIVGDVHSGPVSTIHAVGYVGLALFLCLLVGCAIRAWWLIRTSKGTPFFPLSLFIGISCIYAPFGWVFLFGDFKNDLANTVMTVACLNLLSNGLTAYRRGLNAPPPQQPTVIKRPMQPFTPVPAPAMAR